MADDDKRAYAAKFKDPRWQKRRLEIFSRDEFTCIRCFASDATLHVHHRYYCGDRDPWDYPDEALATLCESCHEMETQFLRGMHGDLIQMMKQAGAMTDEFALMCQAIVRSVNNPLSSQEWSVFTHTIEELLKSRVGDDKTMWNERCVSFDRWCADQMAKNNHGTPTPQ